MQESESDNFQSYKRHWVWSAVRPVVSTLVTLGKVEIIFVIIHDRFFQVFHLCARYIDMSHCKVPGIVFVFVTFSEIAEDMHTQSENNLHMSTTALVWRTFSIRGYGWIQLSDTVANVPNGLLNQFQQCIHDLKVLSHRAPSKSSNPAVTRSSFSKTHKIGNIGIIANFVFLNICSFLIQLYLQHVTLVNVKSDVSGHKRITFQGCRLHWSSFFLMVQLGCQHRHSRDV